MDCFERIENCVSVRPNGIRGNELFGFEAGVGFSGSSHSGAVSNL